MPSRADDGESRGDLARADGGGEDARAEEDAAPHVGGVRDAEIDAAERDRQNQQNVSGRDEHPRGRRSEGSHGEVCDHSVDHGRAQSFCAGIAGERRREQRDGDVGSRALRHEFGDEAQESLPEGDRGQSRREEPVVPPPQDSGRRDRHEGQHGKASQQRRDTEERGLTRRPYGRHQVGETVVDDRPGPAAGDLYGQGDEVPERYRGDHHGGREPDARGGVAAEPIAEPPHHRLLRRPGADDVGVRFQPLPGRGGEGPQQQRRSGRRPDEREHEDEDEHRLQEDRREEQHRRGEQ